MGDAGIICGHCGGRHARPADVRRCSERSAEPLRSTDEATWDAGTEARVAPLVSAPPPPVAPDAIAGFAGPLLGRSVVVAPGAEPPDAWRACERLSGTGPLEPLEAAWRERRPVVIELGEEPDLDEVERRPVWSLTPAFSFAGERRAHAVFANAADARAGSLRYQLAARAVSLGSRAWTGAPGTTPADVVLPDGRPAICDGGPLEWHEAVDGAVVLPRLSLLAGALNPFGANETAAELAPDQLAAVTHAGGAARIIAPAGSGKTRVLTERARHLLRDWRLPGRAVTLVAFNKRAADEMVERTRDLPELQVRTLNALGLWLLGRHRPASTIEEREVRTILGSLVDLPRRANTDPAAAWIEALSAVRLGLRPPAQVEAELDGDVDGLPEVFERYREVLADRRLVDFDEQIYGAIELLLAAPEARRAARATCRALLVDEFQDLTPAHLLLIRLLAGPDGAVFGVGDDDQTIYGYSGASPEWLIDYRRYFPGAGEHALEVNYRCPVRVVEAARHLLTHNDQRVQKSIRAAPGRDATPGDLVVHRGTSALEATLRSVGELLESAVPPAQVAVLSRVNASLAPVQVALVDRGVPVQPAVDVSYLSRGGVQAALAWLRLAGAPAARLRGADVSLAARRPPRGLSPRVVEWMGEQRSVAALEALAGRLSGRDAEKVEGFVADLRLLRARAVSGSTADILGAVRDDLGLDAAMELLETSRRRLDRSPQTDDLDALVALAALHPDPQGFEPWLRAALGVPGSLDGVALSTIHRVKGREWPHVVLHEVSAGLLPHRLAADTEEERRVLHVGLTRGSTSVTIVAGEVPSPFLAELDADRPVRADHATGAGVPAGLSGRAVAPGAAERLGRHAQGADRAGTGAPGGAAPARSRGRTDPGTAGRQRRSPHQVEVPSSPAAAERAQVALRAWRAAKVSSEGKPAYVYLNDRTIEALAARLPGDLAALAAVPGIGPGKLDAYGEELLALIATARQPD